VQCQKLPMNRSYRCGDPRRRAFYTCAFRALRGGWSALASPLPQEEAATGMPGTPRRERAAGRPSLPVTMLLNATAVVPVLTFQTDVLGAGVIETLITAAASKSYENSRPINRADLCHLLDRREPVEASRSCLSGRRASFYSEVYFFFAARISGAGSIGKSGITCRYPADGEAGTTFATSSIPRARPRRPRA
jgi:hypothetical protein